MTFSGPGRVIFGPKPVFPRGHPGRKVRSRLLPQGAAVQRAVRNENDPFPGRLGQISGKSDDFRVWEAESQVLGSGRPDFRSGTPKVTFSGPGRRKVTFSRSGRAKSDVFGSPEVEISTPEGEISEVWDPNLLACAVPQGSGTPQKTPDLGRQDRPESTPFDDVLPPYENVCQKDPFLGVETLACAVVQRGLTGGLEKKRSILYEANLTCPKRVTVAPRSVCSLVSSLARNS